MNFGRSRFLRQIFSSLAACFLLASIAQAGTTSGTVINRTTGQPAAGVELSLIDLQAGMAEASIASGKYDRYLKDGIIPRYGRALDVARAVRFLLEPDNYITGQVLSVDGGITL